MRKALLGLALAATLVACWFAPADEDANAVVAPRAQAHVLAAAPGTRTAAPGAPAWQLVPRNADEDFGNAFGGAPAVAVAAPLKAMAPAVPVSPSVAATAPLPDPNAPPPLPIRFLGRMVDDGRAAYFLQVGDHNVVAHVGDQLDERYVLSAVGEGALTFTYLPLHAQQSLPVGDLN